MQKVVKDQSYHESAVWYNEELYKFAEELAKTIEHPEPKRWCEAVAKQHKFHFGRHQKALTKLQSQAPGSVVDTEDGGEDTVLDDERTVHRSAESGEFVNEETAKESPATTVQETVEVPPPAAQPVEATPDPELAAEPVDAVPLPEISDESLSAGVKTEPRELTDEEAAEVFAKAKADAEAARRERANDGQA